MFKTKIKIEIRNEKEKGMHFVVMQKKDFFSTWQNMQETKKLDDAVEFALSIDDTLDFSGLYKDGKFIASGNVITNKNLMK